MALGLPTYPEFDCKSDGVAIRWKKWHSRLENVFIGYDIQDAARRKALLLTFGGSGLCDLIDSLPAASLAVTQAEAARGVDVYSKTIDVLTTHFNPQMNTEFQKYTFRRTIQTTETVQEFYSQLSELAETCSFADKDSEIKSQIIAGCKSSKLREKGLSNPDLTLVQLLQQARSIELTEAHSTKISQATSQLDAVRLGHSHGHSYGHRPSATPGRHHQGARGGGKTCGNCGFVHKTPVCPAKGKTCRACNKPNHFEKMCRSKKKEEIKKTRQSKRVNAVEETQPESDTSFYLGCITGGDEPWWAKLLVNGRSVNFKIDTGADVTVISGHIFDTLHPRPPLKETKAILQSPGGKLPCLGVFTAEITFRNKEKDNLMIYVLEGHTDNLLSREAASRFGFVQRLQEVNASIFGEVGRVQCQPVKIVLQDDATPYSLHAARRIPIPLLPKVEEELKRMEKAGVIQRITEPTDWCAPIVPVAKPNGGVRLCTDFKRLNAAVKRERYILPTLDNIVHKLHGSTIFSKLDATSGYWQIPLDDETAKLTTFITPFGRFYYRRLPFGISSAPEIFQRTMESILGAIDGVECFQDDVLLHSKSQKEHDKLKDQVFEKIRKAGLTLNRKKCEFDKNSIEFLGHIIDGKGIKPDPSKVQAIVDYPAPENITELRRFLGLVNYVGRFIPDLSTTSKPLNDLLQHEVQWAWGPNQKASFKRIKDLITSAPTLAFFDITRPTVVSADASSYGLGAVLLQETEGELKPIAYASRTLTPAETGYAQIEKECLASVWACEKFQQYLIGLPKFKVLTDHRPLIPLINTKDIQDTPIRCQRLLMRLMRFNVTAEYIPGRLMKIADALSRGPATEAEILNVDSLETLVDGYVNEVAARWPTSDKKLQEIRQATKEDVTLQHAAQHTLQGWPCHKQDVMLAAREMFGVRNELSVFDGLLLRGDRIVIPYSLRDDILEKIHDGHQGINKCRERANQAVWWPGMGKDIENRVARCRTCLERKPSQPSEPMMKSTLPSRPFERVGIDLCEYKGANYLVMVDYYSRYIDISYVPNITTQTVVSKLKNSFAHHGIPETVISDNGRQFTSADFQKFSTDWNFCHVTSSPHFPQANGAAERAVKTAKEILKQEDPFLALLIYRSTPIPELGASPAELAFNRKLRNNLPSLPNTLVSRTVDQGKLRDRDETFKSRQKKNYDRQHGVRSLPDLYPGDPVLIKLDGDKGWIQPGTVREKCAPRSYVVETERGDLRRNRKHLRVRPTEDTADTFIPDAQPFPSPACTTDVAEEQPKFHPTSQPSAKRGSEPEPLADPVPMSPGFRTRSGRKINLPSRFKDG